MEIVGFVSIGILVIIQLVLFTFGYGKMSEKVSNLCKDVKENRERIIKLEDKS